MTDTEPIAWRAIVYGTPVVASDGAPIGSVREVLGSDADDVFHGVRVARPHGRPDVMIASGDVASIAKAAIGIDLTAAEVAALPAFDDVATYHLASVGWLRKHLGWQRDSTADEEPG
jgi:hypothetical protein